MEVEPRISMDLDFFVDLVMAYGLKRNFSSLADRIKADDVPCEFKDAVLHEFYSGAHRVWGDLPFEFKLSGSSLFGTDIKAASGDPGDQSDLDFCFNANRQITEEEWSQFAQEVNQSNYFSKDPEGLQGSKAIRLRDRIYSRRWEIVPEKGHFTFDNVRWGNRSRLQVDQDWKRFFNSNPGATRTTRVLKRMLPDFLGCDVTDLVVRQGERKHLRDLKSPDDASGWDLFESMLLEFQSYPNLAADSPIRAFLRDVAAHVEAQVQGFKEKFDGAHQLSEIIVELHKERNEGKEHIRSRLNNLSAYSQPFQRVNFRAPGHRMNLLERIAQGIFPTDFEKNVAHKFRYEALKFISNLTRSYCSEGIPFDISHGKLRDLQRLLFQAFYHDDKEVWHRCIDAAKECIPRWPFVDVDDQLIYFQLSEAFGLGQTAVAFQWSAKMSPRDPVLEMRVLLMKLTQQPRSRHSLHQKANELAEDILSRLSSGSALHSERHISEYSKPNAWGLLGDYLNLLWMWDWDADQSNLAKQLRIRQYPHTENLTCHIAFLYRQAARSLKKMHDHYGDERIGFDTSVHATMLSLKCKIALDQFRGTCPETDCDHHLEEVGPVTMIAKMEKLRYLEEQYNNGKMDKDAMQDRVNSLLNSGWRLSSLEAWDFDERCRWRLQMLK